MRQQFFDELKKKNENHTSKNLHKNETRSIKTEVKNEWKFEENRTKRKRKSKFAKAIFENYKSKNCNEVQRKLDETQVIFENYESNFFAHLICKTRKNESKKSELEAFKFWKNLSKFLKLRE